MQDLILCEEFGLRLFRPQHCCWYLAANKMRPTNMTPLDSTGMHSEIIDQLKKYQVTHGDRRQILIAGKAGMSEQRCVTLVEIARAPPRFHRARYPR